MKKRILGFLVLGLVVAGCEPTDVTLSRQELLSRSWKMQEIRLNNSRMIYRRGADPADNLVDFTTYRLRMTLDGRFEEVLNASRASGTWQLATADDQLELIYSPQAKDVFDIDRLTTDELNLSRRIDPRSTDPDDLFWLRLFTDLGLNTSNGALINQRLTAE